MRKKTPAGNVHGSAIVAEKPSKQDGPPMTGSREPKQRAFANMARMNAVRKKGTNPHRSNGAMHEDGPPKSNGALKFNGALTSNGAPKSNGALTSNRAPKSKGH